MGLNSKTNIKIIDAICEGPIEGLVASRKSVFLNETKVTKKQAISSGDQPPTVHIEERRGTQRQTLFEDSLFDDAQTVIQPVGERVGKSYSEVEGNQGLVKKRDYGKGQLVQQVRNADADFVQLVFTVSKLFCRAVEGLARGQLFSAKIKYEVAIDRGDGFEKIDIDAIDQPGSLTNKKNTISGISTSNYQFKTKKIKLADAQGRKSGNYKIRVRKLDFKDVLDAEGNVIEERDSFEIKYTDLVDLPKRHPLQGSRADELIWNSIIIGTNIKATYPHTALVHLSIDAEEYGTLPARAYEIKGRKVKIPSNAFVRSESNVGRWGPSTTAYDKERDARAFGSLEFQDGIPFDGTLKENEFYTTCPVCCFYDLLTNSRFGAGDFIDQSNLNWIDLIELSKYCNELVETENGFEPRFAMNTVLGTQAEAYSVLQDMASVFRGMLFWKSDSIQIAADHGELDAGDVPAIHVFSNSNVVNGAFSYSGSSLKTRSTRVRVRYNDPDNFYKPDFICIEDQVLIEKYGVQEKSVVAFGCTSKYQAQRMGKWILLSEKLHDDTVTFAVGLEGLNVLPGQVFEISDEMRFGTRLAGRIVGARVGFVDLDQTATLPGGSNNKLTVVMGDGTVETRPIASVSGIRVTLSEDFTQEPPDDALFAITNDSTVNRKYRCLSVSEGDDGVYGIVGVRHVDGIYTTVDDPDAGLDFQPINSVVGQPTPPSDVVITFQQIDDGRNTTNRATVSWERGIDARPVSRFRVRYKVGQASNYRFVETTDNSIDINSNLQPGKILIVQVQSVGLGPNFALSEFVTAAREIPVGGLNDDSGGGSDIELPPDPENVEIEAFGVDQVVLRWGSTASGQKIESFVAVIRHSSRTDGSGTWPNSVLLRRVEARTTSVVLPLLNGEYLIKFENEQKQRSASAISAIINLPDPIPRLNYEVFREDKQGWSFFGQKNNVYFNDNLGGLVLNGDGDFDIIADVDALTDFSFIGKQVSSGTYFFQKTIDLGAKYSVRAQRVLSEQGIYISDLIDNRTENIDLWSDFDGLEADDTTAQVYFRKNLDTVRRNGEDVSQNSFTESDLQGNLVKEDSTSSTSYDIQLETGGAIQREGVIEFDEWVPLENNAYAGRFFQFKAELTSDREDQTPVVDELGVTFQLERRTENSKVLDGVAGAQFVPFDKPFYVDDNTSVSVGITALDMEPGDYFVTTEPTATGFTITFKGSFDGDVLISRRFSYTAVGYGTREES